MERQWRREKEECLASINLHSLLFCPVVFSRITLKVYCDHCSEDRSCVLHRLSEQAPLLCNWVPSQLTGIINICNGRHLKMGVFPSVVVFSIVSWGLGEKKQNFIFLTINLLFLVWLCLYNFTLDWHLYKIIPADGAGSKDKQKEILWWWWWGC